MSTISLSALWMVPGNNYAEFEWNACKYFEEIENRQTKLYAAAAADAASETTQTHIALHLRGGL